MNNVYTVNVFRFFFLLLIQGLILKNVDFQLIDIFIYPLFILLLPMKIAHGLLVLLGFVMGIAVDIFYNGFGLHTSTLVVVAFARPLVVMLLEPRGGYELGQSLTKYSLNIRWFVRYSAAMCFMHTFILISLEELSLSWIWLGRIVVSFIFSMVLIILYQYIFNPKK